MVSSEVFCTPAIGLKLELHTRFLHFKALELNIIYRCSILLRKDDYVLCATFLLQDSVEEYMVVTFDSEDSTAIVPSKKVLWTSNMPPKEGEVVNVIWNNKKQYSATFIMTGDIKCYLHHGY